MCLIVNEATKYHHLNKEENNKEIVKLKQQIAANLWIQVFAQLAEASAITKLFYLEDNGPGAGEIVHGVWIQAIGQLIEAIGVSGQLFTDHQQQLMAWQRTAINGDWLQSIGATVEAAGGEMVLRDDILKNGDGFIP